MRPVLGLSIVAAGATGYFVGSLYTSKFKFGVYGSPGYIAKYLDTLPLVEELRKDPKYELHRPWDHDRTHMTRNIMQIEGGISDPLVFIDKLERGHTITVTHCGNRTCGFPYLVHGGVLGMILEDALTEAASSMGHTGVKNMSLAYKNPTLVNQSLVVETFHGEHNKLVATVVNAKGKTLVKAVSDMK